MSKQTQTPAKARQRIDFEATLKTLSPLHVGTGQFSEHGKEEAGKPQVALLQRDQAKAPLLPSTSVKGMMRALAEGLWGERDNRVKMLFGEISNDPQMTGQQGLLTVFMARRTEPVPDASAMPYFQVNDPGVFVAARTAIDDASGTADDAKLFFQEMVAPETLFTLRCRLDLFKQRTGSVDSKALQQAVLDILAEMTAPHGVPMGKGQADGLGRLALQGQTAQIEHWTLDDQGVFSSTKSTLPLAEAKGQEVAKQVTLRLHCEGPFVIMDSSHERQNDNEPHIRAQRQREKLPLILGTSVSGALRARAEWLDRIALLNKGADDNAIKDGSGIIERLFGKTSQKALLIIESLVVKQAFSLTQTSVKIDRFSAAPIDGGLFSTKAFYDVRVEVTLSLPPRAAPDDIEQFDRLIKELKHYGLELGHGANKGFGWFTVEVIRETK
jgi:CRISPR/Cas system CSM-associated protein Csm3 (group 7 of RAMP superfamily)